MQEIQQKMKSHGLFFQRILYTRDCCSIGKSQFK